jgi:hypothetical protein
MAIETVNVRKVLEAYGEKIVAALKKALPRDRDASGNLRDSISFTVKPDGLSYKFQLNIADYYKWVDKGRRPGKMPPVSEIIKWTASRQGIFQRGRLVQKKGRLKQVSSQLKLSTNAAWAIARSIQKHGTRGTHFYRNTVPPLMDELASALAKAIQQDVLVELQKHK